LRFWDLLIAGNQAPLQLNVQQFRNQQYLKTIIWKCENKRVNNSYYR
jgi:hypothetical protein